MERNYSAKKGKSVWLITGGIFILFGVLLFLIFSNRISASQSEGTEKIPRILIVAFFVIIAFVSWLFSINSYTLTEDFLLINRPVGTKKIALSEIKRAGIVKREQLGTMIRVFGNGGLFGYTGWFRSFKLGKLYFYATRRDNLVLIEMKDAKKYVISPDNLQLAEELNPKTV